MNRALQITPAEIPSATRRVDRRGSDPRLGRPHRDPSNGPPPCQPNLIRQLPLPLLRNKTISGDVRRALGVTVHLDFHRPVSQTVVDRAMDATAFGVRSTEIAAAALVDRGRSVLAMLPRWFPLDEMRSFGNGDEEGICSAQNMSELESNALRWARKIDTPLKRVSSHAYCLIGLCEDLDGDTAHAVSEDTFGVLAELVQTRMRQATGWQARVEIGGCGSLRTTVKEGVFRLRLERLGDSLRLHADARGSTPSVQIETSLCGHAAIVRLPGSKVSGEVAYKIEGPDGTTPDVTESAVVAYIVDSLKTNPVVLPTISRGARLAMFGANEHDEHPLMIRL